MSGRQPPRVANRDPWARFEAWRYHPQISRAANIRRMFPGLGLGVAAFLVLSAVEELYWKPNHPGSDQHHHPETTTDSHSSA